MPNCPRFQEPSTIRYACMLVGAQPGQLTTVGCAPHCGVCRAGYATPGEYGTLTAARRWLRPHATLESRDALGVFHFMRAGHPNQVARMVPYTYHAELADVWEQLDVGGAAGPQVYEYFEKADGSPWTICDAGAGENDCDDPPYLTLTLDAGKLVTCAVFGGPDWPPTGPRGLHGFLCSGKTSPAGPQMVVFGSPGYNNTAIIHLGGSEGRYDLNSCTPNAGVRFWGHQVGDASTGCADDGFVADGYYSGSLERRAYDYMHVNSITAAFGGNSPEAALKNAVLDWIEADRLLHDSGQIHFDQVDSDRRDSSDAVNHNASFTFWGRTFNPYGATAFDALPVVSAITGRVRKTGHTVSAELVLVDAHLQVNLWLHRIRDYGATELGLTSEQTLAVYPLVRVRLRATLGIRADVAGFGTEQIVQTWRPVADRDDPINLTIQNNHDADGPNVPTVLSDGVAAGEVIDWQWAGEPVHVPAGFEWMGHLGHCSAPNKTFDVYAHDRPTSSYSERMWHGFNGWPDSGQGLAIPAYASHLDAAAGEQAKAMTGAVKLAFAGL